MNNLLIPLVLTVLGVIIMTLFVLPHVYRETKIKDDIIFYRRALFFGILAIYLIGLGFVCLILLKIFGILDDGNFYIHTFVDSLLYLFTSIVGAMIYNHRSKDI